MPPPELPLARWTIGPVNPSGFDCLHRSIDSFLSHHNAEPIICFNCPEPPAINGVRLYDQNSHRENHIRPRGVAWKLYPPRLSVDRHEIIIDNDIIFREPIPQINEFLETDCTLLLEGSSRNYGRFERYIPPRYQINSGIYGMPPGFDFEKYIHFYAQDQWEENTVGIHASSFTFDEQGIVALALLNYPRFVIIPDNIVTNCEQRLRLGKGMHFVSLNRIHYHEPYRLYISQTQKLHL